MTRPAIIQDCRPQILYQGHSKVVYMMMMNKLIAFSLLPTVNRIHVMRCRAGG